jgi:hypothetical protein
MKTKKLGLITLIVLSIVFLFALNASAGWYTCTINKVGPGWSNIYVSLTDNDTSAFADRWFIAKSDTSKEMLAVALTAISNGLSVEVNLSGATQYSTINSMYVLP